ncbi:MAG: SpoIIE family protein phosphatase, partial [Cyanobacteria bacterium P01_H01_bin.121]
MVLQRIVQAYRRNFSLRLSVWIAANAIVILAAGLSYEFWQSRRDIIKEADLQAQTQLQLAAEKLEPLLAAAQSSTDLLATVLEESNLSPEQIEAILKQVVVNDAAIHGAAVALNPAQTSAPRGFAPYYYRQGDTIQYIDLASATYQYTRQDWYWEPEIQREPVWSQPYFDEGGGDRLMTTYSVPVYRQAGNQSSFYGVVTADIALEQLRAQLNTVDVGQTQVFVLLSESGKVLSYPDQNLLMADAPALFLERHSDNPRWRQVISDIIFPHHRGSEPPSQWQSLPCPHTKGECLLSYQTLQGTDWSLLLFFPKRELFATLRSELIRLIVVATVILTAVLVILSLTVRSMTRPLNLLATTAGRIGQGDFDVDLPSTQREDELGCLLNAFRQMQVQLHSYVQQLGTEIANRNQLEGELNAGRQIQMSMLPQNGQAHLAHNGYELWATLQPAKAVSGDLYFFCDQDPEHFIFAIGDVADKGIAAALFMSETMTLIRQMTRTERQPQIILQNLNAELVQNNDNCMFVTLSCGVLDTNMGELIFASAGHTPPLLVRQGEVNEMSQKHGSVIGLLEAEQYELNRLQLEPGDRLIFYTDGVDEAFNTNREMYGTERLITSVTRAQANPKNSLTEIGDLIIRDLSEFCQGAQQSDDITVMVLQYQPVQPQPPHQFLIPVQIDFSETKVIQTRLSDIPIVFEFIDQYCQAHAIAKDYDNDLKLIAEEVITNSIQYGDCEEPEIYVCLAHNEKAILLEVIDTGCSFNPLEETPEPELGLPSEDVEIGGLGVFLVKELSDQQVYQRSEN